VQGSIHAATRGLDPGPGAGKIGYTAKLDMGKWVARVKTEQEYLDQQTNLLHGERRSLQNQRKEKQRVVGGVFPCLILCKQMHDLQESS
jgi:hypothetical protein